MIEVLVVDDDFMVARIHTGFVERTPGFTVTGVAHTGAEALAEAERLQPDLVLLDVYLPDVSGLDLLGALREAAPEVDVLVITAAREADTVRAGAARRDRALPDEAVLLRRPAGPARALPAGLRRRWPASEADQADVDRVFGVARRRDKRLPKGFSPETLRLVEDTLRPETGRPLRGRGGRACSGSPGSAPGATSSTSPRPARSRSACGTARSAARSAATPGGERAPARSGVGSPWAAGPSYSMTVMTAIPDTDAPPHHRRPGHPRLRPQRGRLRGARRPARGRRLPPRRRPGRRRHRGGQHLRLRRGGQEGLRRHAARGLRPQGRRHHQGGRRGRLPGRALRQGPRRVAARGRRRARLRRLPRHRRQLRVDPGRRAAPPAHPAGPPQAAADLARPPRDAERRRRARPHHRRPRPARRRRPRTPAPARYAAGSTAARWRRSSWPAAATGAARSARSRRFRGSFVSRRPSDVLGEARWLGEQGVKELFLVSENSTSYGKDLGDLRLLETLLPELAAVDGVERVRVSYLQPAETRPGLVTAIAGTPGRRAVLRPVLPARLQRRCCAGCAASATRRASSACSSRSARRRRWPASAPTSSSASPARPRTTWTTLCDFLVDARLDVVGVFGYSDEDGTEAASYDGKLDEDEIRDRTEHVTRLVEELTAAARRGPDRRAGRGARRVASTAATAEGRAAHQGPEVDGTTTVDRAAGRRPGRRPRRRAVVDRLRRRRPRRARPADERPRAEPSTEQRAEQLEPPQRADHAAHRDGAVLRLGAARRRRRVGRCGAASPGCCSRSR